MFDPDDDIREGLAAFSPKARDDLRRVLIHDQADCDAISSDRLRYRDERGDDWADIIDMLTMLRRRGAGSRGCSERSTPPEHPLQLVAATTRVGDDPIVICCRLLTREIREGELTLHRCCTVDSEIQRRPATSRASARRAGSPLGSPARVEPCARPIRP